MTPTEYAGWLKELRYAYEAKMPDKDLNDYWFQRIRHVPAEALEWIRDRILHEHSDRFPKRFDVIVGNLWREWLNGNPEKRAPGEKCQECDDGWVTVRELEEQLYGDHPISVAYACARCNNGKRGIATLTKSQARSMGLALVDYAAPFGAAISACRPCREEAA